MSGSEPPVSDDSARRRKSQEELDARIVFVPAAHRLLFLSLAVLTFSVCGWAVFGSVPLTVEADGILAAQGARLILVQGTATGVLSEVRVEPGDAVDANQIVAELAFPILQAQISEARAQLSAKSDKSSSTPNRAAEQARVLSELERRLEATRYLRAPEAGVVSELRASVGQTVTPSTEVMLIESSEAKGTEMIAFLKPQEATRVAVGMQAYISPSTAPAAQFGTILGEVEYTSGRPLSKSALNLFIRDMDLVNELESRGGPYFARLRLLPRGDTPSGFSWSSGAGPPFQISTGTMASARIVVSEQAPIAWVVPEFRKKMGM